MAKRGVIIVAGGMGSRMHSAIPKQFLMLGGMPVLARTINLFAEALPSSDIVVVLPEAYIALWHNLAARFDIAPHRTVAGGKERFHSVRCGIEALGSEVEYIAVHDAVRALATKRLVIRAMLDAEKGWVFQLHMGAVRDVRDTLYHTLGPDSGGDVSDHMVDIVKPLCRFLNQFDGSLKVALYCLEPHHQASLATVARSFGTTVRLGSAWWFNDTPVGMQRQLEYISTVDLLSAFAGMVSDSRKLLSYASRFEMFRRVLCGVVGAMVEQGRIPEEIATDLVRAMCYSEPKKFFNLP